MKSAVLMRVCDVMCLRVSRAHFLYWPVFVIVSVDEQEEQHANTSANYDVELLHHRDAHLEFFKSGGYLLEE